MLHDLKLIGRSKVKHQIDVKFERNGQSRHVLVECKDFDVSGANVGIGIVRNFWAVVEDIQPDEAIVITCNGYTRDAKIYAKSKGIKLAILRGFEEEDWVGRVRSIVVKMTATHVSRPEVSLVMVSEEDIKKVQEDLRKAGLGRIEIRDTQPIYLHLGNTRFQLNEYVRQRIDKASKDKMGHVQLKIPMSDGSIEVEGRDRIPIKGVVVSYEVQQNEDYIVATSRNVAELILEGVGDHDLLIFDKDLERFDIDEHTGQVVRASTE